MNTQKTNIYIIDKDAVILKLYSNMLKSYEYNIKTYTSGYDFLGEYDKSVVSCALIDVNMSELSGIQLFREIKAMGDTQAAKELMCGSEDVRQAFKNVGRPCVIDGGTYAGLDTHNGSNMDDSMKRQEKLYRAAIERQPNEDD